LTIFVFFSPWFALYAIGGEGWLYIFPIFISVLRGRTSVLGYDEIENQLKRHVLISKNQFKIVIGNWREGGSSRRRGVAGTHIPAIKH
jgi:hypothetical protein